MELIYIGDIVNTHGVKGEVRIVSDFKFKETVFQKGNHLYVGFDKTNLEIENYRVHKNYDMVTFVGIHDINDVIGYKGDQVYISRDEYVFDGVLNQDIIGLSVYVENRMIGTVEYILNNHAHDILVIKTGENKFMVPNVDEFVKGIDIEKNRIDIQLIEGLVHEN